jgi:hypothetical protein
LTGVTTPAPVTEAPEGDVPEATSPSTPAAKTKKLVHKATTTPGAFPKATENTPTNPKPFPVPAKNPTVPRIQAFPVPAGNPSVTTIAPFPKPAENPTASGRALLPVAGSSGKTIVQSRPISVPSKQTFVQVPEEEQTYDLWIKDDFKAPASMPNREVTIRGSFGLKYGSPAERTVIISALQKQLIQLSQLGLGMVRIVFREVHGSRLYESVDANIHEISFVFTGYVKDAAKFDEKATRTSFIAVFTGLNNPALFTNFFTEENLQWSVSVSTKTNIHVGKGQPKQPEQPAGPYAAVDPFNTYVIHYGFRKTFTSDAEYEPYLVELENGWQSAIGGQVGKVKVIVTEKAPLAAPNSLTYDVWYVVVFFSEDPTLDISEITARFTQAFPAPAFQLSEPAPDMDVNRPRPNVVVLKDTVYFNGPNGIDYVSKIGRLWQAALGSDVKIVQSYYYDDYMVDSVKHSATTNNERTHEISYFTVAIAEGRFLSVEYLRNTYDQYVTQRSIAALDCGCANN